MKGKWARKRHGFGHKKNQDRKKRYCIDVYNVAHQPNSVKATISQTDRDPSAINTGDHRKKYGVLTAATILINLIWPWFRLDSIWRNDFVHIKFKFYERSNVRRYMPTVGKTLLQRQIQKGWESTSYSTRSDYLFIFFEIWCAGIRRVLFFNWISPTTLTSLVGRIKNLNFLQQSRKQRNEIIRIINSLLIAELTFIFFPYSRKT